MAKGSRSAGGRSTGSFRGSSRTSAFILDPILQLADVVSAGDGQADRRLEVERQLRRQVLQQGPGRADHRPIGPTRQGTPSMTAGSEHPVPPPHRRST